jgi:spermidine synthase
MPYKKILALMFFCSGFCGLLYQLVWIRLAFASFGINTPVLSVVISVFMMGLALGSWWAGAAVSSLSTRFKFRPIYLYGAIELLIGLGAFLVPWLFHVSADLLLKLGEMNSFSYLAVSALLIVFSIVPWCLCMGATYPFMMAFIKENTSSHSTSFSFLYLANVLGALAGTLVTVGVLIELLGFSGTLAFGALLNFTVALLAVELGFRTGAKNNASGARTPAPSTKESSEPLFAPKNSFPLAILFLTGFCSMAMEVVWTRDFTPILRTQVYSFAMILFTYLLATWAGSMLYRKSLVWKKVLSNETLLVYLALSSFLPVVLADPRFNQSIPLVLLTLVPFCGILGYLTPKLIDNISSGQPANAGKAYAVNVVGCILGPLFSSYLFLPWMGAPASLVLLAVPFLVMVMIRKNFTVPRLIPLAAAFALLFLSVFVSQSYETMDKGETRRDYVSTVISCDTGMAKRLMVNGIGTTILTPITKFMAHLPLSILDHKPEKALAICFGMGGTFRSLLSWNIQVTAVELVPSVPKAFGYYFPDAPMLMKKPNAKVVIDDGRRYLKRVEEKYDLIALDPPPPVEAAGSSLLYSKQFYDLAKLRLNKGGFLMQWFPGSYEQNILVAVARAIVESFPYVKVFPPPEGGGTYFICSQEPIVIPPLKEMLAKMPASARDDLMEWAPEGVSLEQYAKPVFTGGSDNYFAMPNPEIIITDDNPFNEYFYLRRTFPQLFWR